MTNVKASTNSKTIALYLASFDWLVKKPLDRPFVELCSFEGWCTLCCTRVTYNRDTLKKHEKSKSHLSIKNTKTKSNFEIAEISTPDHCQNEDFNDSYYFGAHLCKYNIPFYNAANVFNPNVLNYLNKIHKIPSPAAISNILVKNHPNAVLKLSKLLQKSQYYSISFDETSEIKLNQYIVNVLLFDGNTSILLETKIYNHPLAHSDYITLINELIKIYNLETSKISGFVSDGAACVRKAVKILTDKHNINNKPISSFYCISHMLNLLTTYIFSDNPDINMFVNNMASEFSFPHSINDSKDFKNKTSLNRENFTYSNTRWGKKIKILGTYINNKNKIKTYVENEYEKFNNLEELLIQFDNNNLQDRVQTFHSVFSFIPEMIRTSEHLKFVDMDKDSLKILSALPDWLNELINNPSINTWVSQSPRRVKQVENLRTHSLQMTSFLLIIMNLKDNIIDSKLILPLYNGSLIELIADIKQYYVLVKSNPGKEIYKCWFNMRGIDKLRDTILYILSLTFTIAPVERSFSILNSSFKKNQSCLTFENKSKRFFCKYNFDILFNNGKHK